LYPSGYNLGFFKMTQTELQDMSQGEAAYYRLYEAIRAGDFRPGDRLREIEVAKRMALSRTPVREALRKLESDGIVEHRPRLGAVIRTLSPSEVVELYEMRLVLERTAAQMAAKHANGAEIDILNDINDQIAALSNETQQGRSLKSRFPSPYISGQSEPLFIGLSPGAQQCAHAAGAHDIGR
jgi:DNA-binding GntR family transcriptional regulator